MLIDSHCHLHLLDYSLYPGGVAEVIARAKQNGVTQFLNVATSLKEMNTLLDLAAQFPEVKASTGVHPNDDKDELVTYDLLMQYATHSNVIAIGETGLDYYRSDEDNDWQKPRLQIHVDVAKAVKKPLIIHTRNAKQDTIALLKQYGANQVGGVMHCFTEDWEMAQQAMELGFYISFSGIVTFKNATTLQEVAKKIPLEFMLLETDCPYLAPVPFRGKPNEPAYVKYVAEFIANLRGDSFEKIAEATTNNFSRLFTR